MERATKSDGEATWDTSPLADYPVGPDDAGNVVMHGLALVQRGWRWLTARVTWRRHGGG